MALKIKRIEEYDYIIIGAGIYGLYAAKLLTARKKRVAVLEIEKEVFSRASFINQARIHNGYHYPRSLATAIKCASYFKRFYDEFKFAINQSFTSIYAISKSFSFTTAEQFEKFCHHAKIPCQEISIKNLFNPDNVEAAFKTKEYSFDAQKIKNYFLKILDKEIEIFYGTFTVKIKKRDYYFLTLNNGKIIKTKYLINTSYASINQIIHQLGFEQFKIKYEICEISLCQASKNLRNYGLTVMDGPFFSVMPFGLTSDHCLTAVEFTPHLKSYSLLPAFDCQKINKQCTKNYLANCNNCLAKPKSSWIEMTQLAKKYLNEKIKFSYRRSLYAIKPILMTSELDDSRPTIIERFSTNPTFISVLSGKINTIFDLEEFLL